MASNFDSLAGKEGLKAESRKAYEKSQAPKATYKTPSGAEKKIDPKDREIANLRSKLDEQRWVNRQQREDTFYRSYSSRPVVIYNDCYHPYWNYYLMSRPIDDIAMWIYMHQLTMDAARLNWYYSQNADLRARVAALERRQVVRDTSWTPSGMDADLAYSNNYVNAAYNPTPRTETVYEYAPPTVVHTGPGVGTVLLWLFIYIPLMILAVWLIGYMMFCYRW